MFTLVLRSPVVCFSNLVSSCDECTHADWSQNVYHRHMQPTDKLVMKATMRESFVGRVVCNESRASNCMHTQFSDNNMAHFFCYFWWRIGRNTFHVFFLLGSFFLVSIFMFLICACFFGPLAVVSDWRRECVLRHEKSFDFILCTKIGFRLKLIENLHHHYWWPFWRDDFIACSSGKSNIHKYKKGIKRGFLNTTCITCPIIGLYLLLVK